MIFNEAVVRNAHFNISVEIAVFVEMFLRELAKIYEAVTYISDNSVYKFLSAGFLLGCST